MGPRGARMPVVVAALAAAALMLPASAAAASTRCGAAADAGTGAAPASERALALLCLVNRARVRRELRPLRFDWLLTAAAYTHAVDMVGRGYFSHISPDGEGVADRA